MEPKTRNLLIAAVAALVIVVVLVQMGGREPAQIDEGAGVDVDGLTVTDPSIGTGNVTVFLFEDYQCSHCRDYSLGPAFQHLVDNWVRPGNVTVSFRHVAFVGPHSEPAAIASRCVHAIAPDAWSGWDHDVYALQADGRAPTPDAVAALADQHGAGGAQYDQCIADDDVAGQVAQNREAFQDAGVGGTPAIVIAGKVLNPNDTAAVDATIQDALTE